jgi:hypothetical protein
MQILQRPFAHQTTFNGNSFKHSLIIPNCSNSDAKTIPTKPQGMKKAGKFVFIATVVHQPSAVSNCWQLKV